MAKADQIRRAELSVLQQRYITEQGVKRLLYTRSFLLSRLFVRLAAQGDLDYAIQKAWQRLIGRNRRSKPWRQARCHV